VSSLPPLTKEEEAKLACGGKQMQRRRKPVRKKENGGRKEEMKAAEKLLSNQWHISESIEEILAVASAAVVIIEGAKESDASVENVKAGVAKNEIW